MKPTKDPIYLAKLQDYYASHRVIPSYTRLLELFDFVAKSGIKKVMERLECAGLLTRTPDGDWAPTDQFFERPILMQRVPAGIPVSTENEIPDPVHIDRLLIQHPSQTVLIRVKGDSMIDAGIVDGDLAVIERRSRANSGEIVIAIVDEEFTLKRLAHDDKGYFLEPANPNYSVIRPQGKLEIYGVMVGLVRKY
ncbi:S24 family peptidase [Ferrovum sp.]|uniref:LexA family protein n=1 Tax=Ferrovum sp. TaxID=2609467 RepID=UPI0026319CF3|nr:S24 family peptidase [Ferrovum sp.]